MVLQVRREAGGEPVNVLVPPAYHYRFGLRMEMGPVAAIREQSPAAGRDLRPGDVISKAELRHGEETPVILDDIDPVRLADALASRVYAGGDGKGWKVRLTVLRLVDHNPNTPVELGWMDWDPSWRFDEEVALNPASPMAIPELGIAYRIKTRIARVTPGSPAERAGLQKGDELKEIRFRAGGRTAAEEEWSTWLNLAAERGEEERYDTWAYVFARLQRNDFHEVEVKVQRSEKELDAPVKMKAEPDETWPLTQRGFLLEPDARLQKADNMFEALSFGVTRTVRFIQQIYLNLRSVLTGRISTKSLGGPIEIATQAFGAAGEDISVFILFMGIISINLAVVNFLPIPLLDGGHMVFLIYEKLRGRPPSETVRAVATYVGLAMIASLMIFVFYLDIKRRFFGM
jgi:regulator of sigma E protease